MNKKYKLLCGVLILTAVTNLTVIGQKTKEKKIVIKARIVAIGMPPVSVSGARRLAYQLVKYEVLKTIKGKYSARYIVVDNVIFSKNQLSGKQIGDNVVLCLKTRNSIAPIKYDLGIRDSEEAVSLFYIPC